MLSVYSMSKILPLLISSLSAVHFLQEIKLCPTKAGVKQSSVHHLLQKQNPAPKDTKLYFKNKQHLLGEKECTYGPTYWCASLENARKCQVIHASLVNILDFKGFVGFWGVGR